MKLRIKKLLEPLLVLLLAAVAIGSFYLIIVKYALNIPFRDDFDALLNFTNIFLSAGPWHKFALLFSQHHEHRMVFVRLFGLASYYFLGSINFKLLSIMGDLSLIGLLIVLLKSFTFSGSRLHPSKFILPAVLLLFQLQYLETLFWAMQSLSYLLVLFFVFLSLYCLGYQGKKHQFASIVFAVAATFANGNGMLVFPIGFLSLWIQKRYRELIPWVLTGIVSVGLYFIGYIEPPDYPSITKAIFIHPVQTMIYFLYFLGSVGEIFRLPLETGFVFLASFGYLCIKKYYRKNPIIFSFFIYLFVTASVNALCRSGFGIGMALRSDYRLISTLLSVLFYFSAIEISSERVQGNLFRLFLLGALVFNLASSVIFYQVLILHRSSMINGLRQTSNYIYPDTQRAQSMLSAAIAKGYYSPPSY